ncbi:MAG: type I-U CRISPR-associated protein Csx17 [Gammaproteobacteria bacterium]|nr:type I-U CRISPR-associated protein Csx17 [Gammaproteobacteria bacterium]
MATVESLTLDGCSPTPLASYLKALGVLRLISSDANHVSGKAADPNVRGWWKEDQFHLQTTLDRDALIQFLLVDYAPSPIIAPWNGGSGFYPKDNKDGFDPLNSQTVAKRFKPLASAIEVSCDVLARQAITTRPEGHAKLEFVSVLRAEMPDIALAWMDAALALSDSLAYPQLLGTGGNDGRLDFTNNFMRRLVAVKQPQGLFNVVSGTPTDAAARLLLNAIFRTSSPGLSPVAVGQFSPGAAGGPNATTGYAGRGVVNPWDFVLMLEGSCTFASTAARRHQSSVRSGASFPFTVRTVGAGSGGLDAADENDARAEFWAPLWNRPARFREIDVLLAEGRAVLNGKTVRDGLEFARAATSLGISRGFSEFERYGFLMRAGKAFLAIPMGRRSVIASPYSRLVADLDRGGWLERLRSVGREMSTAPRSAVKQLEDALFGLLTPASAREDVERTLIALGRVCAWFAASPKWRVAVGTPPPVLSPAWVKTADDGSSEFRIAAALAGLGLRASRFGQSMPVARDGVTHGMPSEQEFSKVPPMASHLAPVEEEGFSLGSRRRAWTKNPSTPNLVWGRGSLVPNMIAVLERRIIDASTRGLDDKPLSGAIPARLEDVTPFIHGDFDDVRCASLVAGLIWAQSAYLDMDAGDLMDPVPFPYAALKPVLTSNQTLRRIGVLSEAARMPIPTGLISRLRAGGTSRDGRAIDLAVRSAIVRARASGIPSPFDSSLAGGRQRTEEDSRFGVGIPPDRLAAAVLIPITDRALVSLLNRAYSGVVLEPNTQSKEDVTDAA